MTQKISLPLFRNKERHVFVGDFVHCQNDDNDKKPFIARVLELDSSPKLGNRVLFQWMYRLEDVKFSEEFKSNEIFFSKFTDSNPVESIIETVQITFKSPSGELKVSPLYGEKSKSQPLYYCSREYSPKFAEFTFLSQELFENLCTNDWLLKKNNLQPLSKKKDRHLEDQLAESVEKKISSVLDKNDARKPPLPTRETKDADSQKKSSERRAANELERPILKIPRSSTVTSSDKTKPSVSWNDDLLSKECKVDAQSTELNLSVKAESKMNQVSHQEVEHRVEYIFEHRLPSIELSHLRISFNMPKATRCHTPLHQVLNPKDVKFEPTSREVQRMTTLRIQKEQALTSNDRGMTDLGIQNKEAFAKSQEMDLGIKNEEVLTKSQEMHLEIKKEGILAKNVESQEPDLLPATTKFLSAKPLTTFKSADDPVASVSSSLKSFECAETNIHVWHTRRMQQNGMVKVPERIRVGDEYQAILPRFSSKNRASRTKDVTLFSPSFLDSKNVERHSKRYNKGDIVQVCLSASQKLIWCRICEVFEREVAVSPVEIFESMSFVFTCELKNVLVSDERKMQHFFELSNEPFSTSLLFEPQRNYEMRGLSDMWASWTPNEFNSLCCLLRRLGPSVSLFHISKALGTKSVMEIVNMFFSPRRGASDAAGGFLSCTACGISNSPLLVCKRYFACKSVFCEKCFEPLGVSGIIGNDGERLFPESSSFECSRYSWWFCPLCQSDTFIQKTTLKENNAAHLLEVEVKKQIPFSNEDPKFDVTSLSTKTLDILQDYERNLISAEQAMAYIRLDFVSQMHFLTLGM